MMERVRRHLKCEFLLCLLGLCLSVSFLKAQETTATKSRGEIRHVAFETTHSARGPLLVVGGGLLPNNQAIFGKFIERAELGDRTHIGVLPTASTTLAGANRFAEILTQYGVSSSQIDVIPLFEPSAWNETLSLDLIERIRRCTAIYFVGGDQRRIVRALLGEDGTRSAALQAIDDVWKQGGIIGGTSAGAAVQCDVMISVSGLPNDSIDDGMDALDFGMTHSLASPARRGLLATTGLGYFPHGIIDQHFNQRRGRLARLARAIIEMQKPFGFGIDENTALMVQDNGQLEVVGTGTVTILKSAGARCNDGPLGCHITGVSVSCIEQGDRFDPQTGKILIHPDKRPIPQGKEGYNGNFLIPDIAGRGAITAALFPGLADNTSRTQQGLAFKYYQDHAHGYLFTFAKTEKTESFEGTVQGISGLAIVDARLDIEPVGADRKPPMASLPIDFESEQGHRRRALEAIFRRGIMLCREEKRFLPNAPITRREMAGAIAQSIRLEEPRIAPPSLADLRTDCPFLPDIQKAIGSDIMPSQGDRFKPLDPLPRYQAATILCRLAERYGAPRATRAISTWEDASEVDAEALQHLEACVRMDLFEVRDHRLEPHRQLTRGEAAEAIYKILRFPWYEASLP